MYNYLRGYFLQWNNTLSSFYRIVHSTTLLQPSCSHLHTVGCGAVRDKLFREYIFESLYAKDKGYFMDASKGPPLKETTSPIPFQELSGPEQYYSLVAQRYANHPNSWSTPVELFQPWYGYAIARCIQHIVEQSFDRQQLAKEWHIIEVGGGNGTLAHCILQYAKQYYGAPLCNALNYHIVEVSPLFVERQRKRLLSHPSVFFHSMSILDWSETISSPCIVIFCEVLDNLPHDRVEWDDETKTWYECRIRETPETNTSTDNNNNAIVHFPLQDKWIISTMQDWNILSENGQIAAPLHIFSTPYWLYYLQNMVDRLLSSNPSTVLYVPTVAHQVLTTIRRYFPQSHLLIADFDFLPQAIRGFFAPVVQNGTKTFSSIEEAPKTTCDILFPVYFPGLSRAIQRLWNPNYIQIWKQSKFLKTYADSKHTRTKSGFNPMLSDFTNTRILFTRNYTSHNK